MLPTAQVVQPAAEKVEDGIRVVFSLSRDPDANVFNVRALLAPPKVPKQPETTGGPGTTRDDNLNTKAPISAVSDGNVPAGPPVGEPSAVGPDGDGNPAMEADVEDASHESEDDIGAQTDAPDSIPRPGRRRKRDEDDYYDYNDPFIDDSDLQDLVGPVIIQSKLKGYFMWRGQIETVQVAAEWVSRATRVRCSSHAVDRVPESPKKRGPYKKRKQPTIVEGGDQTGPKAGTSTDGAPKKKRKKAEATPAAGALSVHVEAEGIAKHAIGSASTPITPLRPALVGPVSTPKPLGDGEADSQRPLVTEDTPLHQSLLQPLADLQELAALGGNVLLR